MKIHYKCLFKLWSRSWLKLKSNLDLHLYKWHVSLTWTSSVGIYCVPQWRETVFQEAKISFLNEFLCSPFQFLVYLGPIVQAGVGWWKLGQGLSELAASPSTHRGCRASQATHPGFIYFQATVRSGSHSQAGPSPWRASHLCVCGGGIAQGSAFERCGWLCLSSPGWSVCNFKIYWPHRDSHKWGKSSNYKRLLH